MHDQLAGSKAMKQLCQMVTRPAHAGLDMAVAQLLTDFMFLFGCAPWRHAALVLHALQQGRRC